jgi:hypothetical protein
VVLGIAAATRAVETQEEEIMSKLFRLALIVPTLAILAVTSAATALADNGLNLTVEPNATLTGKLEVQLTMTASCPTGWYTMGSTVTVEQAVGKSIAHGSGYLSGLQCTGTDLVIPVTILADPSGPPFHNGPAIASGNFYAYDYTGGSGGGLASVTAAIKLK